MPNEQKTDIETFPDAAAHNAEITSKLENQGPKIGGVTETELTNSGAALDILAKAVVEQKETDNTDTPPPAVDNPPAVIEPTPEEKAAADAAAAEKAAHTKRADDIFKDSPALPPGASPKSSEAFSSIKIKAAQEISAREQQLEEARKKLAEAEEKLKNVTPPEALKELEEHRQWRAKLDVEADPKFKEFDKQVSASHEFIYAQLAKSPAITPDVIAQIKKLGGPENVNLDKIFEAVKDPTLQRIVEAKVAEIETAKWNKEQAIKTTKENIAKYLEDQQKTYSENVGAHNTRTREQFSKFTEKLPWYVEKPIDPKADEPTRKAAEAHNKFVADTKTQLEAALQDDSPEMRAIMLTGMAQLLYLQKAHEAERAAHETTKKALTDATEKLARFTKASSSRLRETAAAPGGKNQVKQNESEFFNTRANESLDNIAKQVLEERARAASA